MNSLRSSLKRQAYQWFGSCTEKLSREAQQKLPCLGGNEWKHYKDIEGPIDISEHALVIAQYESLSQITGLERTKTTLVVVLDEFNSLCNQMDSSMGTLLWHRSASMTCSNTVTT